MCASYTRIKGGAHSLENRESQVSIAAIKRGRYDQGAIGGAYGAAAPQSRLRNDAENFVRIRGGGDSAEQFVVQQPRRLTLIGLTQSSSGLEAAKSAARTAREGTVTGSGASGTAAATEEEIVERAGTCLGESLRETGETSSRGAQLDTHM